MLELIFYVPTTRNLQRERFRMRAKTSTFARPFHPVPHPAIMFYDLFVSFPSANIPTHIPSSSSNQPALPKQSKKSRKANASAAGASGGGGASAANDERDKEAKRLLERERERQGCWFGVASDDREKLQGAVRMERHCE